MKKGRGLMRERRKNAAYDGPKVLVLHEKHGEIIMDATTEAALHRSALRVLRGRLSAAEYFYFEDEERLEAEKAVARKDGERAWEILESRTDHEYERVSLESIATRYWADEKEEAEEVES